MSSILKLIGLVLIGAILVVAFVFFFVWGIALLVVVFAVFGIAYYSNIRFTVSKDGKKIGTYTRKGGFRPY